MSKGSYDVRVSQNVSVAELARRKRRDADDMVAAAERLRREAHELEEREHQIVKGAQ